MVHDTLVKMRQRGTLRSGCREVRTQQKLGYIVVFLLHAATHTSVVHRHQLKKEVERRKERHLGGEKENAAALTAAGTCSGLSVQGLKRGALIHPKQAHHVAGVGVQARDAQAESSSRQREVLALLVIIQVCYLNDKAVKLPTRGAPGRSEAVPRYVRDGEIGHHRPQLLG